MGWLDALVGAAGNAARSTANNTVKAASQPSQRQSSPRQQQSTAPSSNFWQVLSSAVSRNVQRPQQQQGESSGGGWDIPAQSESGPNGSSSAGGTIKQPQKKTEDEKSIYSNGSKQGKSNGDNDIFAETALGLVAPGAAEALAVGNAISQIMGPEKAYAAEGEEDGFTGSGGGTFGMSPETYREAVRENPELFGNKDLSSRNYADMASDMGEAAGIANPIGAGWSALKGANAALKARKAEKATKAATKAEEKAAKAAEKAGIASESKAAKAGKEATEAAEEVAETVEKAPKSAKSGGKFGQAIMDNLMLAADNANMTSDVARAVDASRAAKAGGKTFEQVIEEQGLTNAARKALEASKVADTAENITKPSIIGSGIPTALGATGIGLLTAFGAGSQAGESGVAKTGDVAKDREAQAAENAKMLDELLKSNDEGERLQDIESTAARNAQLEFWENLINNSNATRGSDISIEPAEAKNPPKEKPKQTGLEDEESLAPRTGTLEDQIYGLSRADYNALTQRDQFNKALEDQALRDYYEQTYGADILGDNGYEWFRDLGMDGNMQDKHDLVRDLFGYNLDDKGQSQYGIEGWQELAANSGIDLSGDDEQDIQNILEYMWGAENIINPALYLNVNGDSAGYAQTKNLSDNDETGATAAELANYIMNTYGDFDTLANSVDLGGMDSRDFANMMAFGNMMYNGLGSGFSDADLAGTGAMLGLGGDTAKFGYAGEGEEGFNWQGDSKRNYDPATIYANLAQMYNAAQLASQGQGEAIPVTQFWDVYNGEGVDSAINAHLADDMMAYIQGKNAGKNIKRG